MTEQHVYKCTKSQPITSILSNMAKSASLTAFTDYRSDRFF